MSSSTREPFHVQAHRGACAEALENSLAAFGAAIRARADSVELDVHLTADGELAVYHDFSLPSGRPVHGSALVELKRLTLNDTRRLRGGAALRPPPFPEDEIRIPTLSEVFQLFQTSTDPWARRMKIDIEIKSDPTRPKLSAPPKEMARAVLALARDNGAVGRVLVRSFDHRVLVALRNEGGPLPALVALTDEGFSDYLKLADELHPDWVAPHFQSIEQVQVAGLHAAGVRVLPWTVNSIQDCQRLLQMGVDGVTTDDPRQIIAYLVGQGLRETA